MFRPTLDTDRLFVPNVRNPHPVNRLSDEDLIVRTHARDREASDEIARRYRPLVLRAARKVYLPSGDRGKLEGEGMLGLVKAIRDYREGRGAPFSAFAALCVSRQIITALKEEGRLARAANNGAASIDAIDDNGMTLGDVIASPLPGPHEQAVLREDLAAAGEMIRSLSPLEAECFTMQLEGHDYAEIAGRLRVTVKSVDNAIQRARKRAERFGVGRVRLSRQGEPLGIDPGTPTVPEGYRPKPPSRRPPKCGTIPSVPTVEEKPMSVPAEEPTTTAPTAETWAQRVEREAREVIETYEARVAALASDYEAARRVLATLGVEAPPLPPAEVVERVADAIAGQTTVEEQIAEAEEPEEEDAVLVLAGEKLLRTLDSLGPCTTKRLRALFAAENIEADLLEVIHSLGDRVVFDPTRKAPDDGFPYVLLPRQKYPDGSAHQPSAAERERRKKEAQATQGKRSPQQEERAEKIAAEAKRLGIFTVKRLSEAVFGEELKPKDRIIVGQVLTTLEDEVTRHGGKQGPSVFYTHRDYAGEATIDLARGGVPLRPKKGEAPAPAPEAAPEPEPKREVVMPALVDASGKQAEAAARDQRRVFDALNARDNAVAAELAEATGIAQPRVKEYLRELVDAELVRTTGNNRRAEGQTMGRSGAEYAPLSEFRVTEPEPQPVSEGIADDEEPRLEAVRDAVRDANGEVTLGSLAMRNEWALDIVEHRMGQLEAKDCVKNVGLDGAPVFVYVKPDGAGKAAEAQKRLGVAGNGASVATDAPARGRTVSGTGRGQKATNSDVGALISEAKKAGCDAELTASGHWRITTPDGRKVLIANTPRSSRTVENDRHRLRRVGVAV